MSRPPPRWWALAWPGVATLIAAMGIGRFVYTPILPEMLASGALTLREAGWVAAANFGGYLAGAMAASAIRGRRLQSRLARAGLAATVLSLVAMAFADGIAAWMVARFVSGVASAFALVFVANQVLERLTRIGEGDRIIWMFAGVGVGIAVSALTTLAVQAAGATWPTAWLAAAGLSLAFGAAAWGPAGGEAPSRSGAAEAGAAGGSPAASTAGSASAGSSASPAASGSTPSPAAAMPTTPTPAAPTPAAPTSAAPTSAASTSAASTSAASTPAAPLPSAPAPAPSAPKAFAAAVVAYGLFGLGYVIHATYLPAMVRAAGYPPAAAHWIWVLVGAAAIACTGPWLAFARRRGARAAVIGCYAVAGATALLPMLAGGSIVAAAIAGIGLGATLTSVTGIALPLARVLDPARGAGAIGLMTAAFGAGQIVGPVAAAYLAEASAAAGGGVFESRPFAAPSLLACVVLLAAAALMRPRFDARD
ncbi:MAG TPA: YbfB/YjiJ family MFS transporter [Burkholderiaceae bacterium]|nr:YbfB/YjiJ family MFS transporter [Burkholderiaceae bacterium]